MNPNVSVENVTIIDHDLLRVFMCIRFLVLVEVVRAGLLANVDETAVLVVASALVVDTVVVKVLESFSFVVNRDVVEYCFVGGSVVLASDVPDFVELVRARVLKVVGVVDGVTLVVRTPVVETSVVVLVVDNGGCGR